MRFVMPIWVGGISLAAATGALRVRSGNHFPTDVIASAAVGSFIGWLVPSLHRTGNSNFAVQPYSDGIGGITILMFH